MALVVNSRLPAFESLRREGVDIVTPEDARRSKLPHLTIGLLNLMPDAALRATERQFTRLISSYADRADITVHPFTVAAEHRGVEARRHIEDHYRPFEQVASQGLDALVISGANPSQHDLSREVFWEGLVGVLDWAEGAVRSVMCSCLAAHAVLQLRYGVERQRLPVKRWGLYEHRVEAAGHPLTRGLAGHVDAPHSHWYDVSRGQLETVGARVLVESDEAGVHLAVSPDEFYVLFQGHPEYDLVSLLKEYKREVARFYDGDLADYPPFPAHYFDAETIPRLERHRLAVEEARRSGAEIPRLIEKPALPRAGDTWTEPGRLIYRNWLQTVLAT